MKQCTGCKQRRALTSFHFREGGGGRLKSRCKRCDSDYQKKRALHKLFFRLSHCADLFVEWESSEEFIAAVGEPEGKKCPSCRRVMRRGAMRRGGPRCTSPSLDRLVPSEGYTTANCVWICFLCNVRKNDSTAREMRAIADFIDAEVERRARAGS